MSLINSLCAMLRTTPFHRENYARPILTVIIQFYQRCSDRFQALVSPVQTEEAPAEPRVALASQWAQKAELIPTLTELMNIHVSIQQLKFFFSRLDTDRSLGG